MKSADHEAQISQVREQILKLRAKGGRVRYPEGVKRQVADLRGAGVPAALLAEQLKLAGSQVHDWHKSYGQAEAQVFDIHPSAAPVSGGAASSEPISITIGPVVLTISQRGR